jgi:hypothetical protein
MNVPAMSGGYQTVYQTGAGPTERAPQNAWPDHEWATQRRKMLMKKPTAIDAIGDTEVQTSNQINIQLRRQRGARLPWLSPRLRHWLVRAAYTQSDLADVMRVRAMTLRTVTPK